MRKSTRGDRFLIRRYRACQNTDVHRSLPRRLDERLMFLVFVRPTCQHRGLRYCGFVFPVASRLMQDSSCPTACVLRQIAILLIAAGQLFAGRPVSFLDLPRSAPFTPLRCHMQGRTKEALSRPRVRQRPSLALQRTPHGLGGDYSAHRQPRSSQQFLRHRVDLAGHDGPELLHMCMVGFQVVGCDLSQLDVPQSIGVSARWKSPDEQGEVSYCFDFQAEQCYGNSRLILVRSRKVTEISRRTSKLAWMRPSPGSAHFAFLTVNWKKAKQNLKIK
jgi:hypothetical protein